MYEFFIPIHIHGGGLACRLVAAWLWSHERNYSTKDSVSTGMHAGVGSSNPRHINLSRSKQLPSLTQPGHYSVGRRKLAMVFRSVPGKKMSSSA